MVQVSFIALYLNQFYTKSRYPDRKMQNIALFQAGVSVLYWRTHVHQNWTKISIYRIISELDTRLLEMIWNWVSICVFVETRVTRLWFYTRFRARAIIKSMSSPTESVTSTQAPSISQQFSLPLLMVVNALLLITISYLSITCY